MELGFLKQNRGGEKGIDNNHYRYRATPYRGETTRIEAFHHWKTPEHCLMSALTELSNLVSPPSHVLGMGSQKGHTIQTPNPGVVASMLVSKIV
jgi:hypothetical protein